MQPGSRLYADKGDSGVPNEALLKIILYYII